MSIPQALGFTLAILLVYMTLVWLLSLLLHDASIADTFWGVGFIVAAVSYLLLVNGVLARMILVASLTWAWGLRLSIYLLVRNAGKGEDRRYRAMRDRRPGSFWWYSYAQVFILQGILLWLVSAPLAAAEGGSEPDRLVALDYAGAAVWAVGFLLEVTADTQLALFKRRPENGGKVLDRGVWKYSRHPNYFGEVLIWWGIWLIAAAAGGYWSAYGPVVITVMLLRVSGVTLLERNLKESKRGYAEYVERTSAFVPWFPKKER